MRAYKQHVTMDKLLHASKMAAINYAAHQIFTIGVSVGAGIGIDVLVENSMPEAHWAFKSFCESTGTMAISASLDVLLWLLREQCAPERNKIYDATERCWSTTYIAGWQAIGFCSGLVAGFGVDAIPVCVKGASDAIDRYGSAVAVSLGRSLAKNTVRSSTKKFMQCFFRRKEESLPLTHAAAAVACKSP